MEISSFVTKTVLSQQIIMKNKWLNGTSHGSSSPAIRVTRSKYGHLHISLSKSDVFTFQAILIPFYVYSTIFHMLSTSFPNNLNFNIKTQMQRVALIIIYTQKLIFWKTTFLADVRL